MKLKVPVNSYESTVKQIEAGADEIYMGMEDAHFNRMSYSARAQITSCDVHSNLTEDEFARSVQYAHSKNVVVYFTANCQHITKSDHEKKIDQQEHSSAVLCGQIGEAPDVAQSHSRAGNCKNIADSAREAVAGGGSFLCLFGCFHLFVYLHCIFSGFNAYDIVTLNFYICKDIIVTGFN